MNTRFNNHYRKLAVATALALFCQLAVLLGASVHLLSGDPEAANRLIATAGSFAAIACTLLMPPFLLASAAAAILHLQRRAAHA